MTICRRRKLVNAAARPEKVQARAGLRLAFADQAPDVPRSRVHHVKDGGEHEHNGEENKEIQHNASTPGELRSIRSFPQRLEILRAGAVRFVEAGAHGLDSPGTCSAPGE
jgi:hypothetical protein